MYRFFVYKSMLNLFIFLICFHPSGNLAYDIRTKRFGLVLKIVVLLSLPVPLLLWPVVGIVGSLLGGIGYGYFTPLLSTFEAVGENVTDKFYHCFTVSGDYRLSS